jgi:hypothetical protein
MYTVYPYVCTKFLIAVAFSAVLGRTNRPPKAMHAEDACTQSGPTPSSIAKSECVVIFTKYDVSFTYSLAFMGMKVYLS